MNNTVTSEYRNKKYQTTGTVRLLNQKQAAFFDAEILSYRNWHDEYAERGRTTERRAYGRGCPGNDRERARRIIYKLWCRKVYVESY